MDITGFLLPVLGYFQLLLYMVFFFKLTKLVIFLYKWVICINIYLYPCITLDRTLVLLWRTCVNVHFINGPSVANVKLLYTYTCHYNKVITNLRTYLLTYKITRCPGIYIVCPHLYNFSRVQYLYIL